MYYRRKILLAVLETFGKKIGRTDLQKLLFLASMKQSKPCYEFLPYKFGAYSPQLQQDLNTLVKYNILSETVRGWQLDSKESYTDLLKSIDREVVTSLYSDFASRLGDELIQYTYKNFPFYAIHSEIKSKFLSKIELEKLNQYKVTTDEPILATIGYEGRTVEKYVQILIQNGIQILCDIRKNPLSMKYGFSKKQLQEILKMVNIEYLHLPGLGIESQNRQNLNTSEDYQKLFKQYEKTVLIENTTDLEVLTKLYKEGKRFALTCFEADINSCHRSRTAKKLSQLLGYVEVVHL